jgi:hypothetical protein
VRQHLPLFVTYRLSLLMCIFEPRFTDACHTLQKAAAVLAGEVVPEELPNMKRPAEDAGAGADEDGQGKRRV